MRRFGCHQSSHRPATSDRLVVVIHPKSGKGLTEFTGCEQETTTGPVLAQNVRVIGRERPEKKHASGTEGTNELRKQGAIKKQRIDDPIEPIRKKRHVLDVGFDGPDIQTFIFGQPTERLQTLQRSIQRQNPAAGAGEKNRVTAAAASDIEKFSGGGNPAEEANDEVFGLVNRSVHMESRVPVPCPMNELTPEESAETTRVFLRMTLVPGMGLRSCHRILDRIHDPRVLTALQPRDLGAFGIESDVAEEFLSPSTTDRVATEWERTLGLGARIIDLRAPEYPQLLLETSDPPLVLYVKGGNWAANRPHLAIVGARRASPYGINCAERFAADLAARGAVVVSGLARGIDTAAHRGALAHGQTVAILGTGIDRVYPIENSGLADRIIGNGAILTEFPLGTPPLPDHFPRRNRILAGMTLGTIVVEAAERSGSLITARMALEANREVFAIPGPIQSPRSYGPHLLIRQGACLATSPEDVVDELPETVQRQLLGPGPGADDSESKAPLSAASQRVRDMLSTSDGLPIDLLIVKLGLPVADVYAALLELEFAGLIRQLPGDRYLMKM